MTRIVSILGMVLISLSLGGAQTDRFAAQSRLPDIASLILEGKLAEAVQAASQKPGSAGDAVNALLEAFDLQITTRRLPEASAILQAAQGFLDEFEKAHKGDKISRAPIDGRRLRLAGILFNDQGDYVQAEAVLRQALQIGKQVRDDSLESGIRNNLGFALQYQGKLVEASTEYEAARGMAEAKKDDLRAGSYNYNAGQLYLQLEKPDSALAAFKRSAAQNRAVGQTSLEARAIMMQGVSLRKINPAAPEAVGFFQEAQALFEKLGDDRNTGRALYFTGDFFAASSNYAEAVRYGEMAIPHLSKSGDDEMLRTCYTFLSDTYARLPDAEKSEQYKKLAQSLAIKK